MRYVITIYRPGYLSEGEPYVTNSLEDDGEFLDADTALHVADIDVN